MVEVMTRDAILREISKFNIYLSIPLTEVPISKDDFDILGCWK